jgi:hypothetical protein
MNYLDYWFRLKIANIITEVLSVAMVIYLTTWVYGATGVDDILSLWLVKATLVLCCLYLGTVVWSVMVTLGSLEVDAKPHDKRTDKDKQLQYFVGIVNIIKTAVAVMCIAALLITVCFAI